MKNLGWLLGYGTLLESLHELDGDLQGLRHEMRAQLAIMQAAVTLGPGNNP